jgi:hypothetical protein
VSDAVLDALLIGGTVLVVGLGVMALAVAAVGGSDA